MDTIAGKTAILHMSTNVVECDFPSWTIDFAFDALDDTNWDWSAANHAWRSFITGLQGWTGSFECRQSDCPPTDMFNPGPWEAIFYVAHVGDTSGFSGKIIITGISVTAPIEGIQALSFTFTGVGAPSLITCTPLA